ncbi:MAG: CHASE2 domain-containing protein [Methylococcales bacterium]
MKFLSIHLTHGLRLGLVTALTGLVLSLIPAVADLEKDLGLAWMFGLRGPRPAPAEVVIISIDNESSRELGLEEGPGLWPRALHTQLVKKLGLFGARVIVFDVFFRSERDPQIDREFAAELSQAGNVILFAHVNQRPVQIQNPDGGLQTILMDQLLPPLELIANSALAYAPFPLPKVPERVNQAWLFKSSSGDIATIPVLALHRYAAPAFRELRHELREQVSRIDSGIAIAPEIPESGNLCDTVRRIRQTIQARPELLMNSGWNDSGEESHAQYQALKTLYRGPDYHYIDFYGPPLTIKTIPYYQVMRAGETDSFESIGFDFQDKAVFIGNSERVQPDLKDDFHTVFSDDNGTDLSGVEIMATVFANLLEGRSIQPIAQVSHLAFIAFWGLAIGVLFYLAPGLAAIASAMTLTVSYLMVGAAWFEKNGTWMPLVTPLLLQLPLALVGALLLRYLATHKERERIKQTTGFFLPLEVVDLLSEWKQGDLESAGRVVEGVCLASDAESYTSFAENKDPRELKVLLNRYYELLFQPVRVRGGSILDVAGDSMFAFWENNPCPIHTRLQACQAAMAIQASIAAGGCNREAGLLATRIGLHAGKMIIGNVGAGDHFEFRAVGDMINTTSRIEGLNKRLGTRILASAQVAAGIEGLVIRRAGKFRLKGKDNPLEIFELVCRSEDCVQDFLDLREIFLDGLDKYEAGRWRQAKSLFQAIINRYGGDGPSLFYLHLCDEYSKKGPPEPWNGVYTLEVK